MDIKSYLMDAVDKMADEMAEMSDFIFDHPEVGYEEQQAAKLLTDYLKVKGFAVELGYGGLATAFRAVFRNGSGGPRIGLLCEYDAVLNFGHACAHHLQGPCAAAAAVAIKETLPDLSFELVVIGTPAEETAEGGKNVMLDNGAFKDLDVTLMMHGGDVTQTDVKSMALSEFLVTFQGIAAHSAIAPDKGRSALEALMLVFNGLAFLRGHVKDDTRIHGIIENGGQTVNAIPEIAVARIEARSFDRVYLDQLIARIMRILDGASLMTETSYTIRRIVDIHNKIPVHSLNSALMNNAELAGAKNIMPPREKTGSTDYASVMYHVPGACIRVAFVERGTMAHTRDWLEQGKSVEAHAAMVTGAKILALTAADLIQDEKLLSEVIDEFRREKAANS